MAPDRNCRFANVALGFDSLDGYLGKRPFLGVIAGRSANRIPNARFSLNGVEYALSKNGGEHHLHGGFEGFGKKVWQARIVQRNGDPCLELNYPSRDGEEGYPANLAVAVFYSLTNDDVLKIDHVATTDRDTVLNLTNYSYFNLARAGSGDILGRVLTIHADRFMPPDHAQIVSGEMRPVFGTPMDSTMPQPIGLRIREDYEQLYLPNGYDLNYVLNSGSKGLALIADVYEPTRGRVMQVRAAEPGVQ